MHLLRALSLMQCYPGGKLTTATLPSAPYIRPDKVQMERRWVIFQEFSSFLFASPSQLPVTFFRPGARRNAEERSSWADHTLLGLGLAGENAGVTLASLFGFFVCFVLGGERSVDWTVRG